MGLLKEQDLHGYEIRRRLGEIVGPIARLSFGTLYPALNQLEELGAVSVLQVKKSRTGLTTERGRKVYGITKVGQSLFDDLLANQTGADDERSFAIRLAFAQHLPAEARVRLLQRRREQLAQRLDEGREALNARQGRLNNYSRSLMEHSAEVTANDISWLDRMIANEQQAINQSLAGEHSATPADAQ